MNKKSILMFAVPCMVALSAIVSNVSAQSEMPAEDSIDTGDNSSGITFTCDATKQVCYEVFFKGIKIKTEYGKAQVKI